MTSEHLAKKEYPKIMTDKPEPSPYLVKNGRLADVIAALQALGSYEWASRKVERWHEKLGDPRSAEDWSEIFEAHPEFFRLNGDWASLRWRHAYDRVYVPGERELSSVEVEQMSKADKDEQLSRRPLTSNQIQALMTTAIDLHSRSIAHQQEVRWWVAYATQVSVAVFGLLGVALGALLAGS